MHNQLKMARVATATRLADPGGEAPKEIVVVAALAMISS
jgi:hypothetical protein